MGIVFGLGAFIVGAVLSYVNYRISRLLLSRSKNSLAALSMLRQLISIAYLVILFVFGRSFAPNLYMLLIGGALGITLPSFYLTMRLVKEDKADEKGKEDING
ncbi:MAG: hypothetical protein MJ067_01440 [Oscillospiraceae bacterium]|nr:hypothetical protein [Oscillospiraceae bacterium]